MQHATHPARSLCIFLQLGNKLHLVVKDKHNDDTFPLPIFYISCPVIGMSHDTVMLQ